MALARYRDELSRALESAAVAKADQGGEEHTQAVLDAMRSENIELVSTGYLRRLRAWANKALHENAEMREGGALPVTVVAGPMPADADDDEPAETLSVAEAPGKTEPPPPVDVRKSKAGTMPASSAATTAASAAASTAAEAAVNAAADAAK